MEEEDTPSKINFVPCVKWVKRGVALANPYKVELSESEMKKIIKDTQTELRDAADEASENIAENSDEDLDGTVETRVNGGDEFDLENYDKEDEKSNLFGIGSLTVHDSSGKDPYITLEGSDNESEKDDDLIKPDDNLIIVGHVEGDASTLEIYVYNESEGSLYVHHDIMLPVFPLCLEWLSYDPSEPKPGNLCAVGSMSPIIDVWDLDVVDCLVPAFKLGSKGKKKKKIKAFGHKDAVLDLSWNNNFPHILASGSVDQTVLLWDLDNGQPSTTLAHFSDKVSGVKWHPFEGQTLLTGSCDKTVKVFDCHVDDSFKSWNVDGEVERVIWNHFNPFCFLASTDIGSVHCIDCRTDKSLWQLSAHNGEVSGLALSTLCKGVLFTTGNDGSLKVWDIENDQPFHVAEKSLGMGAVQCLDVCPESAFVTSIGGENKSLNFRVIDLMQNPAVEKRFSDHPLLKPVTTEESSTSSTQGGPSSSGDIMDTSDSIASLSLGTNKFEKASTSRLGVPKKRGHKFKKHFK